MKRLLKRLLSESGRRRARRLGRIRWVTKARVVRSYGASPLSWWRYVLSDPEVDSFTYPIANRAPLAEALASLLERPREDVLRHLAEADTDAILRDGLRQPLPHLLWSKRRPEPRAYHLACWVVVRLARPRVVVETGILDGMASTVILAGLERNAREGHPGELISFDVMPRAGAMVPSALRGRWQPVHGDAAQALPGVIGDRRIGFFASDSVPDVDHIRCELDTVLAHRDETLVALTAWGSLGDLRWPTGEIIRFTEEPRDHFSAGTTFAAARFTTATVAG